MKLFIGLGNPGKKYQLTRHNVGAAVIEKLASINNLNLDAPQSKLQSSILELPSRDARSGVSTEFGKVLIAIPNVYMNESGIAVSKIVKFYKIPLGNLYIIHDDLDLPLGEYRLQFDRGPAGHHGVESIIQHLGSQAFHRIRVGIGHPSDHTPVETYVLQPFSKDEKVLINPVIDKITAEIKLISNL